MRAISSQICHVPCHLRVVDWTLIVLGMSSILFINLYHVIFTVSSSTHNNRSTLLLSKCYPVNCMCTLEAVDLAFNRVLVDCLVVKVMQMRVLADS